MLRALRSRFPLVVAALIVVAAGLTVRAVSAGTAANFLGSALYTTMLFTLILVVRPWTRAFHAALVALGASVVVELSQLTPFPDEWSRRSSFAHLVLGAHFEWLDLLAYVCGAAVALLVAGIVVPVSDRSR